MPRLDPLDLFDTVSLVDEGERTVRDTVARFMDDKVLPLVGADNRNSRINKAGEMRSAL